MSLGYWDLYLVGLAQCFFPGRSCLDLLSPALQVTRLIKEQCTGESTGAPGERHEASLLIGAVHELDFVFGLDSAQDLDLCFVLIRPDVGNRGERRRTTLS